MRPRPPVPPVATFAGHSRSLAAAAGAVLALLGGAVVARSASARPAAAVRCEARTWADSLLPPPFAAADDPRSLRGFPPDSLSDANRPKLQATWVDTAPPVDGELTDWPVVRWHDVRGGPALVRGSWNGTSDAALAFALLWTSQGLVLGAKLHDDSLVVGRAGAGRIESVLVYIGSTSTVVQRYWTGGERAVRVWADGRLEAWTRWHNRRAVLFDPHVLGARGAATVQGPPGRGGTAQFELFVPWDLLFPALPHDQAALLVNVLVEDVDGGSEKLFAWVVRPAPASTPGKSGPANARRVPGWARLFFGGGPPAGTWLLSSGTRHLEAGFPYEWSLLRWGETAAAKPVLLSAGEHGEKPSRVEVARTPALVRYHARAAERAPWPRARRLELDVGITGRAPWRHDVLHWAPTRPSLALAPQELPADGSSGRAFPRRADLEVRSQKIDALVARLGDWRTARHGDRGALASRAAAWAGLENRLLECQLLRDMVLGPPDPAAHDKLLGALWPERSAPGFPVGVPVLRGQRAVSDGSAQPYAVYLSRAAAAHGPAPLAVVLHDIDDDEMSMLADGRLGEAMEARGWIAVSPYARGNMGYQLVAERDVLDMLQQVRRDLPVDPARVYVTGFGMGGTGTWLLSLRHADVFAAAAIVGGYGDMDQPGLFQELAYLPEELFYYETLNPARLLRPGLKTAFRVVHAEQDPRISVVHARVLAERLREYALTHEVVLPPTTVAGRELFARELDANLDFMAAHGRVAVGEPEAAWFGGVGGPVASVFARGPFAVVRGTQALPGEPARAGADSTALRTVTGPEADARCADNLVVEWRTLFGARPRVLDDTGVDAALQDSTNLVLVGDPRTNRIVAAVAPKLPVRYDGDRFAVEGKSWDFRDAGILFATAHPGAADRTLVVLSGMPERLGGFRKSLLKLGADYIVVNDSKEVLAVGHFRGFGGKPRPGAPGNESR